MKVKKVFLTLSILLLASAAAVSLYTYSQLNKLKNVRISKTDEDLGINLNMLPENNDVEQLDINSKINDSQSNNIGHTNNFTNEKYSSDIKNIALFGVDAGRNKYDVAHSDSIIIATIDPKNNKIKLSSIMRDTYVSIKGHGKSKITNAYAYGGPQLALRTLNENFGLNIRDYVTVDFFTLEKAIDVLGGVTVDIKANELKELNYRITEAARLQNKTPDLLKNSGAQNLNGIQAVAYCRIRKIGNGDFERTSRQRLVLSELINKTKSIGIVKYHSLASEIFPLIETSLSSSDILKLGRQVITTGISNVEQQRFPLDGYYKGEIVKGVWYLVPKPDISTLKDQISKFIFKDVRPDSKEPLF